MMPQQCTDWTVTISIGNISDFDSKVSLFVCLFLKIHMDHMFCSVTLFSAENILFLQSIISLNSQIHWKPHVAIAMEEQQT